MDVYLPLSMVPIAFRSIHAKFRLNVPPEMQRNQHEGGNDILKAVARRMPFGTSCLLDSPGESPLNLRLEVKGTKGAQQAGLEGVLESALCNRMRQGCPRTVVLQTCYVLEPPEARRTRRGPGPCQVPLLILIWTRV